MPFLCRERKHLTAKHKTIIKLFAISREREKKFHSLSELRVLCASARSMQKELQHEFTYESADIKRGMLRRQTLSHGWNST
jgi:hypothetical protein